MTNRANCETISQILINTKDRTMEENDQEQTQTIKIPEPLSPEDFRTYLIMDVRENATLEPGEELSDDEAYKMGIDHIFDSISRSCVNSDYEELYDIFEYFGFYNDEERSILSALEANGQEGIVPSILRARISNVDEIDPILSFYDTYSRMESAEKLLQLNQSVRKFKTFSSSLARDVKGQMYYNASLRYQEFMSKNKLEYQYATGQELNMIKKSLFYTADPEIIAACEQRIDPNNKKDTSLIKIAYKNALNKTDDVDALYQIHCNLGQIYLDESKVPGYKLSNSDAIKSLNKSITHYQQASELANTPEEKLSALRSLANVQKNANDIDEWAITKCEIAKLIDNPHDRYSYLIGTAQEISNSSYIAKELMHATLKAIKKDPDLNKCDKNRLQLRAYMFLNKTEQNPEKKADFQKKMLMLQKRSIQFI